MSTVDRLSPPFGLQDQTYPPHEQTHAVTYRLTPSCCRGERTWTMLHGALSMYCCSNRSRPCTAVASTRDPSHRAPLEAGSLSAHLQRLAMHVLQRRTTPSGPVPCHSHEQGRGAVAPPARRRRSCLSPWAAASPRIDRRPRWPFPSAPSAPPAPRVEPHPHRAPAPTRPARHRP